MKNRIVNKAKEDIPLYFGDFKSFWDASIGSIEDDDLGEIYKRTLIFKNWKTSLHSISIVDRDSLLDELFEDINSTFYMALLGQYRSAFMHMRSSIELSLQLLYFIHHPIEYHQWKSGKFLIKFNVLTDYLEKHPNLIGQDNSSSLLTKIIRNWKTYSKHIHGESPIFFQCERDVRTTNSFSMRDFGPWKQNYLTNIYLINKLYIMFFKDDLSRFPTTSYEIIVSLLEESDSELLSS